LLWHEFFTLGHAELKPDMLAALLCEDMKWTYQQYRDQPAFFIDILMKMKSERSRAERNKNP